MRTASRVRPAPQTPFFLAALLFSMIFSFGTPAASFEEEADTPADVEEPAEVAPDGAEAPEGEMPSGDNATGPRALDRGVFRPDLKTGSENAPPPQPAEESKQDKLGAPLDALALPDPAEKPKLLDALYVQLAKAKDAEAAAPIMQNIETLWRVTGSATVDLLISRAQRFTKDSDLDLARQILDAAVAMAPEEAEGLYLRAKVHYLQSKYDLALADLRRALDRDPKHYRALEDLGLVFEALGTKKEALEAYRKALEINPFLKDAGLAVQFLSKEVDSRNL